MRNELSKNESRSEVRGKALSRVKERQNKQPSETSPYHGLSTNRNGHGYSKERKKKCQKLLKFLVMPLTKMGNRIEGGNPAVGMDEEIIGSVFKILDCK